MYVDRACERAGVTPAEWDDVVRRSGNVFAKTLGLPPDAGGAVQRILTAVEAGVRREIGLGLAGDRYFTFSAGLGVDAEVIGDMERQRAHGRRASVAGQRAPTLSAA